MTSPAPNPKSQRIEDCAVESGRVVPRIDRNRCEGKEDCVRVCPYNVFEIRTLTDSDRASLSFIGRLKARAHGNRQAYLLNAADCNACGLCITACPEKALKLVPVST
jgi:4Fe-4S ferredoxin